MEHGDLVQKGTRGLTWMPVLWPREAFSFVSLESLDVFKAHTGEEGQRGLCSPQLLPGLCWHHSPLRGAPHFFLLLRTQNPKLVLCNDAEQRGGTGWESTVPWPGQGQGLVQLSWLSFLF